MAEDGYNRNQIIGGYRGAPIKSSMLGKNLKTRGALSNNLPFRLANGLAPGNEYQFLFPTGTEAGAVWRFSQSGGQYQDTVGSPVTAVGQAVAIQADEKNGNLGANIATNGDDWAGWNVSGGFFTIKNGLATGVNASGGAAVFKAVNLTPGKLYKYRFNLVYYSAGQARAYVWNPTDSYKRGNLHSTVGVCEGYIYANGTVNFIEIGIEGVNGFTGSVKNFTLQEMTCGLIQVTATSRPLTAIESIGGWNQSVYSGRFDGIDDALATPAFVAGTLTNNMDFFMAVKRNSGADTLMLSDNPSVGGYIGVCASGNVGICDSSVGTVNTYFVDGVQIGGIHNTTRDQLNTAISPNAWHVVEVRNLDLTTWTKPSFGGYPLFMLAANVGDAILCPAQSTANRNLARTLVGASVGLLL